MDTASVYAGCVQRPLSVDVSLHHAHLQVHARNERVKQQPKLHHGKLPCYDNTITVENNAGRKSLGVHTCRDGDTRVCGAWFAAPAAHTKHVLNHGNSAKSSSRRVDWNSTLLR